MEKVARENRVSSFRHGGRYHAGAPADFDGLRVARALLCTVVMKSYVTLVLLVGCTDAVEPVHTPFGVSDSRLALGPVTCGAKESKLIRIENPNDEELVLAIDSDLPEIEVQPELVIPPLGAKILPISATIYRPSAAGTVTLVSPDHAVAIEVTMLGIGIPVTFDPPVLDFGSVLPNTTKDLPLTVTLGTGANFGIDLGLGPASTPRFEVVGTTVVQLRPATPAATFLVRYHASVTSLEHDGTMPIAINGAGSCTPPELALKGTTVP